GIAVRLPLRGFRIRRLRSTWTDQSASRGLRTDLRRPSGTDVVGRTGMGQADPNRTENRGGRLSILPAASTRILSIESLCNDDYLPCMGAERHSGISRLHPVTAEGV